MGTWAHGSFDNDDALDWAGGLTGRLGGLSGLDAISEAFEAVLNSEDDIESFNAASALAAAEVVAALLGNPAKLPDEVSAWVAGKEPPDAGLIQKAAEVVRRVLKSSELKDLWAESEESVEWQAEVEGLLRRLAHNPAESGAAADRGRM